VTVSEPNYPMKLVPRLLGKPWGGRRIETVLRRRLPIAGPVGESWEVHDRDGSSSEIANGPLAGMNLADVRGGKPFPLLVKLLDATQTLSVQVHPDAEAASRFGGEAKTECWFVLHAEPGARVFRGLRDGCTREELADALKRDEVESCLHSFAVKPGDTIFVPAGTVHSIGAGVVLAEVQQNSDTTYRLHDWGRPRELHVREALDSIRFGFRSPDTVPAQVIEDEGSVRRELLISCRHFAAECVVAMGTFTLELAPATAQFQVLHVLTGEGEVRTFRRGVEPVPIVPGDTLLLPAEHDAYEIATGSSVFRGLVFRA
jgi:mannose-6-phosphate isomerase